MKIDINGCVDSDLHAICIRKGDYFLSVQSDKCSWETDIELCACFLSEKKALACMEELRSEMGMDDADLIWTDTRFSIYHDLAALRKFEEDMNK